MRHHSGPDRGARQSRLKTLRYVKAYRSKGETYYYFRRDGFAPVRLPGLFGSIEWREAYDRALDASAGASVLPIEPGAKRTIVGSINAALVAYYRSADFADGLAASTQAWRRRCLEKFRADFGDVSIRKFEKRHAQKFVSLIGKAGSQRNMGQALTHFFEYCVATHLITDNPAAGIKRVKMKNTGGIRAWTEDDVDAFKRKHPPGSKAHLALALYLNFGVRKSDVIRIGPRDIKGGALVDFQPQKTSRTGGVKINVPLLKETALAIQATPVTGADSYLVTTFGKPFTANGFGNKMRDWCDQAGLPECSSHGLRKLVLIRLAELGLNTETIMAISGHKNRSEVDTYVAAFNRKKLAAHAIGRIEAQTKNEMRLSNRIRQLDNRLKK
jgi:integrase